MWLWSKRALISSNLSLVFSDMSSAVRFSLKIAFAVNALCVCVREREREKERGRERRREGEKECRGEREVGVKNGKQTRNRKGKETT